MKHTLQNDILDILVENGGRESFSRVIEELRRKGWKGFSAHYINGQFADDLELAGFTVERVWSKPDPPYSQYMRQRWITV